MRRKTTSFLALLLLIGIMMPVEAMDWTMLQADMYHSGITSDRSPIVTPNKSFSWEYGLDSEVLTFPVVADGVTYVVSSDNKVSAINTNTKDKLWQKSSSGAGIIGNLAYGDGRVFVATSDGCIYAFEADTGRKDWDIQVTREAFSTPIVYYNKSLYFGNSSRYYCYDNSGNPIWTRESSSGGSYNNSGAAVIGSYLVYGDDSGYLVSVRLSSGTAADEFKKQEAEELFGASISGIKSSVVYDPQSKRIYFSSDDGACYYLGFDMTSGTFDISDTGKSNIFDSAGSVPVVYNSRIYLTGETGGTYYLICLNATDFSVIWKFPVSGKISWSPVLSTFNDTGDGEVYIYFATDTTPGKIYCIEDKDGFTSPSQRWTYSKSDVTTRPSGLVISDGNLLFGTRDGYLVNLCSGRRPMADFNAYPKMGAIPLTVSFTDHSTDATAWEWDVDGDGHADYTTKNCWHRYDYAGRYTVTLRVTNSFGEDEKTKADFIVVNLQTTALGEMSGYSNSNTTLKIPQSTEKKEDEVFVIDMGATASPNIDFGTNIITVEDVFTGSTTNNSTPGFTGIISLIFILINAYYIRKKM